VNIRDLQYLVALADHGHFGKAADECAVSQPALSMQIKKLEQSLGVKLLERTNKSVMLTDSGTVIAERAREILHQVAGVREFAKSVKDPYSGELKLGIFPTLAPYLMPHIIPPLGKIFPKLFIHLVEEKTTELLQQLKQGKIDAAILGLPVEGAGFTSTLLFEEEFLFTVPHSHPLAKKAVIKQQDLDHKSLLLLDDGHCMRAHMLSFCHQMHAIETKNFRATSLETLRHMVAAGAGITLMPKLSSLGCDLATFIPFEEPKPVRSIGLIFRSSTTKTILLTEIVNQLKNILRQNKYVSVVD